MCAPAFNGTGFLSLSYPLRCDSLLIRGSRFGTVKTVPYINRGRLH